MSATTSTLTNAADLIVRGDLSSVKASVLSVELHKSRVSEMQVTAATYKIGFLEEKPGDTTVRLCLEDTANSKRSYPITNVQLAALRVCLTPDTFVECFVDEFITSPNCLTLQEYTVLHPDVSYDDMTFRVFKRIPLRNHRVADRKTPIYKDVCYVGYADFAEATAGVDYKVGTKEEKDVKWAERARLRNILHVTKLNKGMDKDENIECLPVFDLSN